MLSAAHTRFVRACRLRTHARVRAQLTVSCLMSVGGCLNVLTEACVQAERRLDPLPAGFLYDGRQYVDVFGQRRSLHPSILPHGSHRRLGGRTFTRDAAVVSLTWVSSADMEDFIREYVAQANREAELFNHQLELQEQTDLFEP